MRAWVISSIIVDFLFECLVFVILIFLIVMLELVVCRLFIHFFVLFSVGFYHLSSLHIFLLIF